MQSEGRGREGSLFPFGFPTAIDRVPQIDMSAAASFCSADVTQDVLVAFIMRRQAPCPCHSFSFRLRLVKVLSVVLPDTHTRTYILYIHVCVCLLSFVCFLLFSVTISDCCYSFPLPSSSPTTACYTCCSFAKLTCCPFCGAWHTPLSSSLALSDWLSAFLCRCFHFLRFPTRISTAFIGESRM